MPRQRLQYRQEQSASAGILARQRQFGKGVYRDKEENLFSDKATKSAAKQANMRMRGHVSSLQPGGISEGVENFFEWLGATEKKDGRVYLEDIRMTVRYWPDTEGMPEISQTIVDWSIRSAE